MGFFCWSAGAGPRQCASVTPTCTNSFHTWLGCGGTDICLGQPVRAPPMPQPPAAFPIPVPHASYWLNKGDAADLSWMGAVRVINACDVFWQPEGKGLKAGIDQNKSREPVLPHSEVLAVGLYWSSVVALPAAVGSGSYMLNTTTAKPEFGTRETDAFFYRKRVLGSCGSDSGAGAQLTRGQHPTILFQKTSILWSTAEEKWQEIEMLQRKFCRTDFTSNVVSRVLFTPLMFENTQNRNYYHFSKWIDYFFFWHHCC